MKIDNKVNIGSQLGGGGAATLERTSFSTGQAVQQTSKARLADNGGGGNNGGGIKNGGGGGDGDEGDDDDYYDEGDDEGEGDSFISTRAPLEGGGWGRAHPSRSATIATPSTPSWRSGSRL